MKRYFSKLDDEHCYSLKEIKEDMIWEQITEMEVTEAKRVIGVSYFFCTKYERVSEKKHCGVWCKYYSSRNHKNGRCRYSGYCYEPTDKKRIIRIKSE